jgi:hypothetical protein
MLPAKNKITKTSHMVNRTLIGVDHLVSNRRLPLILDVVV